jgi:hypothetical protein
MINRHDRRAAATPPLTRGQPIMAKSFLVERGQDGRLRAEGVTDYSEHFRVEQDTDGTWRVTDGMGVMFRGLDSEERAWVMANYSYAIVAKPMKGEAPEQTKARINRISIKRKMQ